MSDKKIDQVNPIVRVIGDAMTTKHLETELIKKHLTTSHIETALLKPKVEPPAPPPPPPKDGKQE